LRYRTKLAVLTGTLALGLLPALAIAAPPAENPGLGHVPTNPGAKPTTPGPNPKGNAYGNYCQDQSKKRSDSAPGTKGTPFSQCVTAMAKLAAGQTDNPRTACKDESKKHVKGQKGTPFSRCVSAAAKLHEDQPTT
jgi:hypothetical protein